MLLSGFHVASSLFLLMRENHLRPAFDVSVHVVKAPSLHAGRLNPMLESCNNLGKQRGDFLTASVGEVKIWVSLYAAGRCGSSQEIEKTPLIMYFECWFVARFSGHRIA